MRLINIIKLFYPNTKFCSKCGIAKIQGKELIFLSNIGRDGKTITDVSDRDMSHLDNDWYYVKCVSITYSTYIASAFNTYTVKLK